MTRDITLRLLLLALGAAPYLGLLVALPALRARLPAALRTGELRAVPRSAVDPPGTSEQAPSSLLFDLFLRPLVDLAWGLLARPPHLTPLSAVLPPQAALQVRMFQLWSGVLRGAGPIAVGLANAIARGPAWGAGSWLVAWWLGSSVVTRSAARFARYSGMSIAADEAGRAGATPTD